MNLTTEQKANAYMRGKRQAAQASCYEAKQNADKVLEVTLWLLDRGIPVESVYVDSYNTVSLRVNSYNDGRLTDAEFAALQTKLKKFPWQYRISH